MGVANFYSGVSLVRNMLFPSNEEPVEPIEPIEPVEPVLPFMI